jgi:hypothetical protein
MPDRSTAGDRVREILAASAQLTELQKRVHETVRRRDRGPEELSRWQTACKEFRTRYPTLFYPGGQIALEALKTCGPASIETAVDFLVADPMHFRSGYTKEFLWAHLMKCRLLPLDKSRLEDAGLGYARRRIDRSFWAMGRAMSRLASSAFWKRAYDLKQASEAEVATRFGYLLVFKDGPGAGAELRRKINLEVILARDGSKPRDRKH